MDWDACSTIKDQYNIAVPNLTCLVPYFVHLITIAISFAGTIAVLLIIYAGVRFITAGGNKETIEGAKKTITYAIIGLVIILMSFVAVNIIRQVLGLPQVFDFS